MKILQVNHEFPPYSFQGSQVYCFNLTMELAKKNEVRVLHASQPKGYVFYPKLKKENYFGIQTYYWVDNIWLDRINNQKNIYLISAFENILESFKPDIIHFHNFINIGDRLIHIAKSKRIKIIYTLHDYGLACPLALLLKTNGTICEKDRQDYFRDCCPLKVSYYKSEQILEKDSWGNGFFRPKWIGDIFLINIRYFRIIYNYFLGEICGLFRGAVLFLVGKWLRFQGVGKQTAKRKVEIFAKKVADEIEQIRNNTNRFDLKKRFWNDITENVYNNVDLFIAPSKFLMNKFIQLGLPSQKIRYLTCGQRIFKRPGKSYSNLIRFGFIGAPHKHKGIEILIDAFLKINEKYVLNIYGSVYKNYQSLFFLKKIKQKIKKHKPHNINFKGEYKNSEVDKILSNIDVLIVPSIWFENAPITIQEAFMAGVPVITSNVGGMAESVADGVNGLHFKVGDAEALKAKVQMIINDPSLIEKLSKGIPEVKSIERNAEELEDIYKQISVCGVV